MALEGTTVILIRHAERLDGDPHLTSAGKARAERLVHVLGHANVSAIYISDEVRTKETAQPLADELGLTPVEATLAPEIQNHIRLNHAGKTVLVIGHTNTVPRVIEMLGGNSSPDIDHREFDNMFVATVLGESRVRVTRLKYGDPT